MTPGWHPMHRAPPEHPPDPYPGHGRPPGALKPRRPPYRHLTKNSPPPPPTPAPQIQTAKMAEMTDTLATSLRTLSINDMTAYSLMPLDATLDSELHSTRYKERSYAPSS